MTTNNIEIQWQNGFVGQKQGQQSRQGDWICVQCNNLNFSFRKRCNRCKNQSREQNEEQIRQAYQYYSSYYRQMETVDTHHPQTLSERQENSALQNYGNSSLTSPAGLYKFIDDQLYETELPSVSPYIKRYNKSPFDNKIKTQISQGWSSDQESSNESKQEYLSQYCWQNILVDDDEDFSYGEDSSIGSQQNCIEDYSQIEKLVQNIVL